jgi:hypothetical protein
MIDVMVTTPEDESTAAAIEEYAMVVAQQEEYGWEPKIINAGDYVVIFVRFAKPEGRTFLMRLRRLPGDCARASFYQPQQVR